jgi:hypothetical protein
MHSRNLLTLTISTASLLLASQGLSQQTHLLENSTTFTGEPPSLVNTQTPSSQAGWPSPQYFFTFNLPPKSIESLGKVTIQQEPNIQTIHFALKQTKAFLGTQDNQGKALKTKTVTLDRNTQTITVVFDPPIPPGTTFTISLQAQQNPSLQGVYRFIVNAFPAGANPIALKLGTGQLNIYGAPR